MVNYKLPERVVLYRSGHPSQEKLRTILNNLGIAFYEIQYLAELQDLSAIEKSPCVLAIIDGEMKGIEFLRSVMHYHPWTQRMLVTSSADIRFLEQAINKAHVNYLLSLPLSRETLKVYLMKANKRFQNLIRPINKLGVLSSVTSDLLQENERMRLAASTDALTKLPNRRSMNLVMENLWHQYITANVVFSFAMLDIDHFKNVNDRYGHEAGDRVLQALAKVLLNNLREEQDFAFRYGGEEFVLISNTMCAEKMYHYVSRLLNIVRKMVIRFDGQQIKITFSAGVSDIKGLEAPQMVIHQADMALYQAKNSGRNRIVVFKKE